jgi:cytochrome P450
MDIERFNPHLPSFTDDPYPVYAHYQKHDPVHWGVPQAPGGDGCWYLFGYHDVVAVLKDSRFLRKWPPGASAAAIARAPAEQQPFLRLSDNLLLSKDPPDHQRLRGLVAKAFSPGAMESYRERVQSLADALIGRLDDRTEFDLVDDFALPLSLGVICKIMGIPSEEEADLRRWSAAIANGINFREGPAAIEAGSVATLHLMDYFRLLFARRRQRPGNDLVSSLLDAGEKEGRLDEEETLAMCIQVIFAGHETSVNFIANSMLALFDHPMQRTRLQGNPDLLRGAVHELLRFAGSVQTTAARRPKEDISLGGKWIRAGEPVIAFIGAANRDPSVFAHAHCLDLRRTTGGHLAFGSGIHACLGVTLARMEAEVAIGSLMQRWPDLHLKPDHVPRWRHHAVLRGPEALPVSTVA